MILGEKEESTSKISSAQKAEAKAPGTISKSFSLVGMMTLTGIFSTEKEKNKAFCLTEKNSPKNKKSQGLP